MSRRTPMVRFITLLLATLQFLSPGVSAIADGRLARDNASRPATHVEATTTAACPVVHHPDCGVCRYLSSPAGASPGAAFDLTALSGAAAPNVATTPSSRIAVALPRGRAPPAL